MTIKPIYENNYEYSQPACDGCGITLPKEDSCLLALESIEYHKWHTDENGVDIKDYCSKCAKKGSFKRWLQKRLYTLKSAVKKLRRKLRRRRYE